MIAILFQTGRYTNRKWDPDGEPYEAHPYGDGPWRGFPTRTDLEDSLMAMPGAVRISPDVIEYDLTRGGRIRAIFPADAGARA